MPLYEILKISYDGAKPHDLLPLYESGRSCIARGDGDLWLHLQNHAAFCNNLAIRYLLIDDREAAARYAGEVVPAAMDYFFGDWRTRIETDQGTVDPDWWHARENWMDVFKYALCWGAVLGQWPALKKLARYPDEERSEERSGINKKPALRRLLLDAAAYLRGEKGKVGGGRCAARVTDLVGASWRGMKAHATALDAIADGDGDAAESALDDALQAVRRARATKDIAEMMPLEATFLYYLARRARMKIAIRPNVQPLLISLSAV